MSFEELPEDVIYEIATKSRATFGRLLLVNATLSGYLFRRGLQQAVKNKFMTIPEKILELLKAGTYPSAQFTIAKQQNDRSITLVPRTGTNLEWVTENFSVKYDYTDCAASNSPQIGDDPYYFHPNALVELFRIPEINFDYHLLPQFQYKYFRACSRFLLNFGNQIDRELYVIIYYKSPHKRIN